MIKQTLSIIPEEKNALAQMFSEGDLNSDEKTALMEQLQYLQSFQNEAGRFQTLADNNLDTTSAAERIKELFLGGQPTGATAEIYNDPKYQYKFYAGKPDYINDLRNVSLLDEGIARFSQNLLFKLAYPNATKNLGNSLKSLAISANEPFIQIVSTRDDIKNKELNQLLKNSNVDEDSRGMIFHQNSKLSKTIANSDVIDSYIKENYNELKQGKMQTSLVEFKNPHNVLKFKDTDLFLAFQHVTFYKPHIDDQGNFRAFVVDNYDFERRNGAGAAVAVNNWGSRMQEQHALEPHFYIIEINKKVK